MTPIPGPRRDSRSASSPSPSPSAEPPPPVIELRSIGMAFGQGPVLRDISLSVPQGQTLCVIGESGCGKTVLLKLMIGLLRPSVGRVFFEGRDVNRLSGWELTRVRLRFGFLFQMAALFDSLTIFDNVAFGPREHGLYDPATLARVVRDRLQEVGLPPGIERKKPAELSGGQRKRVGLARALALDPQVMLYDEPTTGLDPIMSDVINQLILHTQRSKQATGVVVTHDLRTVAKVADRVVMLEPLSRLEPGEPQILYDGPPDGLEDAPDDRVRRFVKGEAGAELLGTAWADGTAN